MRLVLKRYWFPLSLLLLLGLVTWQFHAARAGTLPDSTTYETNQAVIRIASDSSEAHAMEESRLFIEVHDQNGLPIDDARIRMKIWMPNMYCGEFQASVSAIGPGRYEATSIPVMSGRWKAEAVVQIGEERFTLDHLFMVSS